MAGPLRGRFEYEEIRGARSVVSSPRVLRGRGAPARLCEGCYLMSESSETLNGTNPSVRVYPAPEGAVLRDEYAVRVRPLRDAGDGAR